jgi:membrane-bound serine protease (ClpP class)
MQRRTALDPLRDLSVSFPGACSLRTLPTTVGDPRRAGSRASTGALGFVALLLALVLGVLAVADPVLATTEPEGTPDDVQVEEGGSGDPGRVSVIEAEGLIDPVLAAFIERSIRDGERAGVIAVVIQLDSAGSVVSGERLNELARTIHDATVPVAVWVGPSGSHALGGAAQLAGAARRVGIAPGARLGKTGDLQVDESLLSPGFLAAAARLEGGTINEEQARELGIMEDERAAVIGEFIIGIDGVETRVVEQDGRQMREPVSVPVFSSLPVQDQLFHTVASPPAAYLLLLIGLSLIVFELYTAGIGVAGLVGAACLVLASYGLAVLPIRPLGLVLLVISIFGFAVDVQTGVPRFWSAVGGVTLVAGSILLFDGLSLSWITLLVGIGGTALAMLAGMPAMVRTRFSTPTIGREWMIGEEGEAVTTVDPDGVVRIRGALWRARTNRATPIASSDPVRVTEVHGLLLEVEPLEGGAVDYREKRGSSS